MTFSFIPKKWPTTTLADAGKWLSGGTPSRGNPALWGGNLPWFGSKDVRKIYLGDASETLTLVAEAAGARVLPVGTLLMVTRGMSLAKEFRVGLTIKPASFNQDVKALIPCQRLEPRFLTHYLRYVGPRVLLRVETASHGTKRLPTQRLFSVPIPVPPLPEQRRIAAILDKADEIRRKRRQAIVLTEELLRSAFLEMVGPANPAYEEWPRHTIESLAARTKNSMRSGPFGSALKHSEFVAKGVAVLGIDNAVQNRFRWQQRRFISQEKYTKLQRYTVMPDDVIITIMGTTGRSAVVPADIPTAITTKHLATTTLNRNLAEPQFISHAIHLDPAVLGQIASRNRGATMPGLNLGLIRELQLRLPPLAAQKAFSKAVQSTRTVDAHLVNAADETESLFESLVQRAFQGEL